MRSRHRYVADCWVSDEISGRQRRMLADHIKVLTSEAGDTSVNSGHLFDTTETGSKAWSSDVFASNGEATAPCSICWKYYTPQQFSLQALSFIATS